MKMNKQDWNKIKEKLSQKILRFDKFDLLIILITFVIGIIMGVFMT